MTARPPFVILFGYAPNIVPFAYQCFGIKQPKKNAAIVAPTMTTMMMVMGMIGMVRPPFVFIWVFVTLTSSKVSSMI
jgi:hypothetical protein